MSRFSFLIVGLLAFSIGCGSEPEDPAPTTARTPASEDSNEPAPEATRAAGDSETGIVSTGRTPEEMPQPVAFTSGDWPQYRGQLRDGISPATGLLREWPAEGPRKLWEVSVGEGYAAPSVVAERVYINDYDEDESQWMVRCLALDTGDELWRYAVKKRIRPNHAITRSAPATDGGFVFSIDPKCELHCLDARDGSLIWKKFLPVVYDTQIPAWYNGQCPLIDGDRLVIATGGRVLLTALDKATGDPIWETENSDKFQLTHSSITPVEIDGVKQYTYTTFRGLVGVDAESGSQLWHFPWKFNTAVSTSPLPLGDRRFLLTAGYHAQTVVCEIAKHGDEWTASEVVSLPPPSAGWNSEVHTPIVYRDRIYGVGKSKRGQWTCLDLEGNELWTSEGATSFGLGGYALADGMFFVLEGKTGVLRVLDANADQYSELANVQLLEGPDVWAPPVISHGRLLIRDLHKLICLDIAAADAAVAESAGAEVNQQVAVQTD